MGRRVAAPALLVEVLYQGDSRAARSDHRLYFEAERTMPDIHSARCENTDGSAKYDIAGEVPVFGQTAGGNVACHCICGDAGLPAIVFLKHAGSRKGRCGVTG